MDLNFLFWLCMSFIIHFLGFILFTSVGFSPSPSLIVIDTFRSSVTSSGEMTTSERSAESFKTVTVQKTHPSKPTPIARNISLGSLTDGGQNTDSKGLDGYTSEAPLSRDADDELRETLASLVARINELKRYPKVALLRRIEGVVLVSLLIYQSGEISQEHVQQSSGFLILDEEALRSIRELGKTLPLPTGKRELRVEVPIRFKIKRD